MNSLKKITLVCCLALTMVLPMQAQELKSITLWWDASPSADVQGYRLHSGVCSGVYTNVLNVGDVLFTSVFIPVGVTYFAATAYNAYGVDSPFSNEVSCTNVVAITNVVSPTNIVVSTTNAPPTLDPIADLVMSENEGPRTVTLSGITSGATNENQSLVVTAVSESTDLIPHPIVSYTSPNVTGTLTFTPTLNSYGRSKIFVTVNDGGETNNTTVRSFRITVNALTNSLPTSPTNIVVSPTNVVVSTTNATPTLDPILDVVMAENEGPKTVTLSGITSGSTNENQKLVVSAMSGNTDLIPSLGVTYVSPNETGLITFMPRTNTFGISKITVAVNDGGLTNNLVSRTFSVTVNLLTNSLPTSPTNVVISPTNIVVSPTNIVVSPTNVVVSPTNVVVSTTNTAPTLNPIADVSMNQNGSAKTIQLSGISSGSTNEIQKLVVMAVSENKDLIPDPLVSYTSPNKVGWIRFAPTTNSYGTSKISVTVNDGGETNNTVTRSFVVTVKKVNQYPVISAIPDQVIQKDTSSQPIAFTIGDLETPVSSLRIAAITSNPLVLPVGRIVFGGSDSNRTVTLTPVPGKIGSTTIGVIVTDGLVNTKTSFRVTVVSSLAAPPPLGPTLLIRAIQAKPKAVSGSGVEAGILLTWESTPGEKYRIWFKELLTDIWVSAHEITASETLTRWETPVRVPVGFYRVELVQ